MTVLCLVVVGGTGLGSAVASGLSLTQRVLKAGELAGMEPSAPPKVIRSVVAWAQGNKTQETQLRKAGFVAGVADQMVTSRNPNRYGLSLVVEVSSAASAEAALTANTRSNGPWTDFKDLAIPGAIGFAQLAPDSSAGGRNVGFTLGSYFYVVGAGWQGGAKNAVSLASVRAAALILYHRVSTG